EGIRSFPTVRTRLGRDSVRKSAGPFEPNRRFDSASISRLPQPRNAMGRSGTRFGRPTLRQTIVPVADRNVCPTSPFFCDCQRAASWITKGSMETMLHRQLKALYAGKAARMEERVAGYRIDAVRGEQLIEIQHGGLAAIRTKIGRLLQEHSVLVVKPLV